MLIRVIYEDIERRLFKGKVMVILGPRQVGKTTLMKQVAAGTNLECKWLNCDEEEVRRLLENANMATLRLLVNNCKICV